MSRSGLPPAYTCGTYHRQGRSGCTSHHIRADKLDALLKLFIERLMRNSEAMIARLNAGISGENDDLAQVEQSADNLAVVLVDLQNELKATKWQRIRDVMRHPEQESLLEETYGALESDLQKKIEDLNHQIDLLSDKRNAIIQGDRVAKTALDVLRDILTKERLERSDLELIIDRIKVFEDHLEVKLQADIDALLRCEGLEEAVNFDPGIENSLNVQLVRRAVRQKDKAFGARVIGNGDALRMQHS